MSLDTTERKTSDELFIGKSAKVHGYHTKNNLTQISEGKERMYESMLKLILENSNHDFRHRFLSLPGKFWRFELRLSLLWSKHTKHHVEFTAFERDRNVILSGAGYVPRTVDSFESPRNPGFRQIESLKVEYFRTNRARWVAMDINTALTLTPAMFREPENFNQTVTGGWQVDSKRPIPFEWWINKFCHWDAAWLDYYGPCSNQIGDALANLHWHCRPSANVIPVGVTVLKGREAEDMADRKIWLQTKLSGNGMFPGLRFSTVDYFEYSEGGATMCNILGLINRG